MTAVILLLALPACVTPFAEKPAAPAPVVAMAAPEAPAIAQPEAPRPAPPEPALDAETRAIIETAIAALAPAEQAMPEPPVIESMVIEVAPEPDIDDDPGQLIGLAGPDLAELLGEPGFRREDADAQIWQYGGGDCALDIYLYRGGEAMPHRVTYYEFRGGEAGRPCFRALLLAEAG